MKLLTSREWIILAAIIAFSFIPSFGGLLRVLELSGGPAVIPANPRALAEPLPIVAHIFGSFVFCIGGAVQFLPSIRRERPGLHRGLGRVVAVAGIVSAATGLWMTHFFTFPSDLQGGLLYGVRMIVGLAMISLIGCAIFAIKSRNISHHRAAMLRANAIGQGASTQAFLGIAWIIATGTEPTGTFRDGLMVSAWIINVMFAEILIGKFITRRPLLISARSKRLPSS